MKFHLPFGRKSNDDTSTDEWFKDYIGDDDDDEEDEEEDDYPYISFDFSHGLFDGDDEESLGEDDTAFAWMSRGKDEDYTFGYSEDELENS